MVAKNRGEGREWMREREGVNVHITLRASPVVARRTSGTLVRHNVIREVVPS